MQTKSQRITCKYITYFQKSKEAGLAFNYLINQSTDTKGLCHMVFPPSVLCSNNYYTADKNYISFYFFAFPSAWNAPPIPSSFYSAFWFPARSRTNATSLSTSSSPTWKWVSLFCFLRSVTLLFGSHVGRAMRRV